MKYLIHILIIVLAGSLIACDNLITTVPESKLPSASEKIVIHSYISPQDTVILVKVTLSSPVLGVHHNNGYSFTILDGDTIYHTNTSIYNAKVVLSNSRNQSIVVPYNKAHDIYMFNAKLFPIVAGETYTLTAEASMGKVEATCTVPKEMAVISSFKIDTVYDNKAEPPRLTYRINFDWIDIPGKASYYTMKAEINAKMLLTPFRDNRNQETLTRVMRYTGYWDEENRQEQYQSDVSRDGKILSTPNGIIALGTEVLNENNQLYYTKFSGGKSNIRMEILNTDKNYYNYHRAVRINNRQDGNPFVEPVPIPTNVKNGLGCFAASNKYVMTVVY